MRVVFDSNVWVAALAASGTCKDVVQEALSGCEVFVSPYILREVDRALASKIGAALKERQRAGEWIRSVTCETDPPALPGIRCPDPKDLPILWLALAVHADWLVTGDKALLGLKEIRGIGVIPPAAFWKVSRHPPHRPPLHS